MKSPWLAMMLACSTALAVHGTAAAAPVTATTTAAPQSRMDKAKDAFDMGQLMQFVDKLFPAQPAPPPERVALARATALGVLPNGTYAAMFDDLMTGMVDRILAIRPADLGDKQASKADSGMALRDHLAKGDPHFDERMRITRRIIGEEMVKVSALLEPKLRDGLALSIARRFDAAQLREINAFLATGSGRAFGAQTMRMWMDPDVVRSMIRSFPDMMLAMPGAAARLEAATAHLPKPKKPEPVADEEAEEEEEPAEDEVAEEPVT